jgi:subtilase family serine protease
MSGLAAVAAAPNIQLPSTSDINGYGPDQIRHAYGFDSINFGAKPATGAGTTIAIVDAFSDPNVASDLATFDSRYGLPAPPKLTVATPEGPAPGDSGWGLEISLDVQWSVILPAERLTTDPLHPRRVVD